MRAVFIVPAYNEASSLPFVVQDLRRHYPDADVVVVNDGSIDRTVEVAMQLGVLVLDLPFNLGIGGAVQTGLLFAKRNNYDVAVQFDGDGQHRADQVSALLSLLASDEADVVIGSRFVRRTGYQPPPLRRMGIVLFRLVVSGIVGQNITDCTSGFRAYSRPAISFLAREYPHDYPEPESVVTLCRHGFRVQEVSVLMRERHAGRSSITLPRSVYYIVKVLLAIGISASRKSVGRLSE
jgi:glycosyltransferase involved in cell wall biosynthesis